tara:strand:- start:226 stop:624 length:399 start_codon:yes stop_codon:yes gene_type:complete
MNLAKIKNSKTFRQLFGFIIAGCLANFLSLSIYIFAYKLIGLSLFISSISGQILGLFTNYIFNSRIVFKKRLKLKYKFLYFGYYFLTIYVVGISIEFIYGLGVDYIISWFICMVVAAFSNFLFIKYFAFSNN